MGTALSRERVLSAIRSFASKHGLPTSLMVLSERGNLVAQPEGSDIIIRAQYLNAFMYREPVDWMRREVTLAAALTGVGARIAMPHRRHPPGPHEIDGVLMTLWESVAPGEESNSPHEAARSLKDFHDAAGRADVSPPWLTPITMLVPETLGALSAERAVGIDTLKALWQEYERVRQLLESDRGLDDGVVHGDAHSGNLIRGEKGLVWIDLEDVCIGALEWDLACLWRSRRLDGHNAVNHYLSLSGASSALTDLRSYLDARELEETVWFLAVAYQQPERYKRIATESLDRLMSRIGH